MEEEKTKGKQQEEEQGTWEETKDMDIRDMDLEGIEKECVDVGMVYVPQKHVILLKESILRSSASNQLRISLGSHKETKRNFKEPTKKSGRK